MKKFLIAVALIVLVSLPVPVVFANIGVGVGTGKIAVDEELHAGTIYKLPSVTVINTGDEPTTYELGIEYMETQPELKPKASWFSFSPESFLLQPGKAQPVEITLHLPLQLQPGKYYAFVEGRPKKIVTADGKTTVGVAAAAKLTFTVAPSSILEGLYYKLITFWKVNQPWSSRISMAIGALILLLLAKKYLRIQVNVKK